MTPFTLCALGGAGEKTRTGFLLYPSWGKINSDSKYVEGMHCASNININDA